MKWDRFVSSGTARMKFVPGDWKVFDDLTGAPRKASEVSFRWDGLTMPKHLFEHRHPQDFLRGYREKIAPPWTRPEGDIVINTSVQPSDLDGR